MNAKQWSTRLTWITDSIALIALATTDEVQIEFWAIILAIFVVSQVVKARFSVKWAFGILATILVAAIYAGIHYRYHPIVMAAYGAPLIHSITWLVPNSRRTRGWRMGFGFGELILSSALTVEAYLIFLIFAFIIIAAVSSSCLFLEGELETSAKEISLNPLPAGYIRRSMGLACVIFLISLLIFPILPRMKLTSKGWDSLQTGYTEKVNLTEGAKFGGNSESGSPLLWLFSREKKDLSIEIPYGLIRGRSLDVFDGANWSIGYTPIATPQEPFPRKKTGPILVVDAIRAPSTSSSLPVPYGTFRVFSGVLENDSFARHFEGDWVDPRTMRENAHYSFAFEPQTLDLEGQSERDKPRPIQLAVPESLKTKRIKMLADGLFRPGSTEKDKVLQLGNFFLRKQFKATLESSSVDEINRNPSVKRMQPLERFLFISKEGNCEWFATASAILLRMSGVPTRMIAGFRLSRGPVGGVLAVRSSDAHAWIEYWSKANGWVPFDPTPRLVASPSFSRFLADTYELFSNYWYRFILGYSNGESEKAQEASPIEPQLNHEKGVFNELRQWRAFFLDRLGKKGIVLIGIALLMFSFFGILYWFMRSQYPWFFSSRHRLRLGRPELWQERLKMEKLLKRHAKTVNNKQKLSQIADQTLDVSEFKTILPHPLVIEWEQTYLQLRFGRVLDSGSAAVTSLVNYRRELDRLLHGTV